MAHKDQSCFLTSDRREHMLNEFWRNSQKLRNQQWLISWHFARVRKLMILDKYREKAASLTNAQLQGEVHSSSRMARYMRRAGDPRPSKYCDAHAIISGNHFDAMTLRLLLAWAGIRIDDPFNGCWLPRDWEHR